MSTLALTRRRTSVWGIVAILAATATAIAVYSYLSWLRSQVPIAGKLVPMVVASRDLSPGTLIAADMVRVVDHPENYLPSGALLSLDSVVGKVVSSFVFEGDPITARRIADKGGLSAALPKGMRAYSLVVTSGLGVIPRPGDRVDVIVTFPREVLGEATSMTVLRSREVASVGVGAGESGEVASRLGIAAPGQSGVEITLYVTGDEAQRLAMAESLGRVTVVLAPMGADDEPALEPVRPSDLRTT